MAYSFVNCEAEYYSSMNYSIGSSGFLFTSMICYWTGLMVVVGTEEGVKEVEKPQKLVQSSYVYSSTLHQKHISNYDQF